MKFHKTRFKKPNQAGVKGSNLYRQNNIPKVGNTGQINNEMAKQMWKDRRTFRKSTMTESQFKRGKKINAINRKNDKAAFRRVMKDKKMEFKAANARLATIKEIALGLGGEVIGGTAPAQAGIVTSAVTQNIRGGATEQEDRGQKEGDSEQTVTKPGGTLFQAAKGRNGD